MITLTTFELFYFEVLAPHGIAKFQISTSDTSISLKLVLERGHRSQVCHIFDPVFYGFKNIHYGCVTSSWECHSGKCKTSKLLIPLSFEEVKVKSKQNSASLVSFYNEVHTFFLENGHSLIWYPSHTFIGMECFFSRGNMMEKSGIGTHLRSTRRQWCLPSN